MEGKSYGCSTRDVLDLSLAELAKGDTDPVIMELLGMCRDGYIAYRDEETGHKPVLLVNPFTAEEVEVDIGLSDLISNMWGLGIETYGWCDGTPGKDIHCCSSPLFLVN